MISALLAGATIYWLQEYAFYTPVAFTPANQIELTLIETGLPEPILAENVTGVNADSSPIRFRACFTTPQSMAMLTETYQMYDAAEPLIVLAGRNYRDPLWPQIERRASVPMEGLGIGQQLAWLSDN